MRIIIIHRSFALVGGAERVIIDKANYLAENGHQVKLLSYEQGAHEISYQMNSSVEYEDLDCRFFTLSKYSLPLHLIHFFQLKRKFRQSLTQIIKAFSPNVIVLASDWTFLTKPLLKAAKDIPVICEFHNSYDHVVKNIGQTNSGIISIPTKVYIYYAIKVLKKCARLISLTENDARHWEKITNKVSVIPNPLAFFPETTDDIPKIPGRIIFVGRLNTEKRIDRLISAFSMISSKHPAWHIDIFGEGVEKETLERLIISLEQQNRIIIHQPTDKIIEEYKKAQFLVLSSEYEARPLVLPEAMSCGTPCISFNCPSGPAEIIDDHVTGLLAKNGDIKDLAEKMEWLITHDTDREKMGKNARLAAEKYKPDVIMKEWEKVYTSACINTI